MTQPPTGPYGQAPDDDPYRTPPPGQQQPGQQQPGWQQPAQQQPGWQPSAYQPAPPDPYGAAMPTARWGWDGRTPDQVRAEKPGTVTTLLRLMLLGAFLELVRTLVAFTEIDDIIAASVGDIEQAAADSGVDTGQLAEIVRTAGVAGLLVSAVLSIGLWLLFWWLFGRGSGRVVGTVLGSINGAFALFGLFGVSLLQTLLGVVYLGVVVAALVMLWRPATSLWFRQVAAARQATGAS